MERDRHSKIDFQILLIVIGLVLFGLIMLYSSSFIFAQEKTGDGFSLIRKQILYAVLGFATLSGAALVDFRKWSKWALPLLGGVFLLLAAIFIPGVGLRVGGARRWLHLGGWQFQPGELAKFAVIFFVAKQLERESPWVEKPPLSKLCQYLIPIPILGLLLMQPDFGTTAMIVIVVFMMIFLAGAPRKMLLTAVGLAGILGSWLVLGTAYRRARLSAFLNPWNDPGGKGFQILQSLLGVHNGSVWGVGLGNGKEKLFFLPEAHNDFIFSVIGEELGFVGIAAIVLAYLLFIYRGLKIAFVCRQRDEDRFGMLLAAGITLAIGIQALVNISVVLGLVPTKGLTLPFISYGGSALLVDLFAIGVLLNIARGRERVSY